MHVLLIIGRSRAEEALLLSASEDRIRIMRRGQQDAIELRRVEGQWVSESGAQMEIGALLPVAEPGWETLDAAHAAYTLRSACAVNRLGQLRTN